MNHDTMAEAKWRWKFSLIYWDHFLCFFIILHTGRIDYGTFQQRLVDAWGWISSDVRLAVIAHLAVLVNSWISKCHHCPLAPTRNDPVRSCFIDKNLSSVAIHVIFSHCVCHSLCPIVRVLFHSARWLFSLLLSITSKTYNKVS